MVSKASLEGASPDRMPRMTELFGLPGAGKTTIASGVPPTERILTRSQASAAWRSRSVTRRTAVAVQAVTDLEWVRAIVSLIGQTPLTSGESLARMARLAATRPWLQTLQTDLLFDQGLLQRLWSIFYTEGVTAPPQAPLERLLARFYDGFRVQIVALEVPPDIAARRIHGRDVGGSRLDELPEDTVLAKLRDMAELPAALLAAARAVGLSVVTLDGSAPVEDLTRQLQAILRPSDCENAATREARNVRPSGEVAAR